MITFGEESSSWVYHLPETSRQQLNFATIYQNDADGNQRTICLSYPVKKPRCLPRIQAYMPMTHDGTRNTCVAFDVKIESKLQHLPISVEYKTRGRLALR